jgi:hypothetical protein
MNNLNQEQINQLLKFAIGGYWSALQEKLSDRGINSAEIDQLLKEKQDYQLRFQERLTDPHLVADYQQIKTENEQLKSDLATERETTQEALRTSQEWHERQKREITEAKDLEINQLKQKHQTYLNQRKSQIHQEITLLKEILRN